MRARLATCGLALCALSLAACGFQEGVLGDNSLEVDAGGRTLADVLSEFRCDFGDAGFLDWDDGMRATCNIAVFYKGCPLRVCADQLRASVQDHCALVDMTLQTEDSRACFCVMVDVSEDSADGRRCRAWFAPGGDASL